MTAVDTSAEVAAREAQARREGWIAARDEALARARHAATVYHADSFAMVARTRTNIAEQIIAMEPPGESSDGG